MINIFKVGDDDISGVGPETLISSGDKGLGTRVGLTDLPLEVLLLDDQNKNGRKDTVDLINIENEEQYNMNDSLAEQIIKTASGIISFVPDAFSKLVVATDK